MALEITKKNMNELDNFEPSSTSTFGKFLEWIHSWVNTLRENINSTKYEMELGRKNAILFGTYVGNGAAEQNINLGFEPIAVEVYTSWGAQSSGYPTKSGSFMFGGLAIKGYPCEGKGLTRIQINTNGFTVYTHDDGSYSYKDVHTNDTNITYYFKAYRYGEVETYA